MLKREEESLACSLLNIICRQIWYQSKSDYMDRASGCRLKGWLVVVLLLWCRGTCQHKLEMEFITNFTLCACARSMQLVILIALKPASHHNSKEMTTSKRKKRMHRIAAKWVEIHFEIVFLFSHSIIWCFPKKVLYQLLVCSIVD